MKAIIAPAYGSPEVLQVADVPMPIPKANQIRVNVKSATVNRTDIGIMRAKPFIMRFFNGLWRPKNQITGTDFAGVVESVGASVTQFQVGDRVFGFNDMGLCSHAEYLVIDENEALATIPDDVSFAQATASAEGAHYAYNMVNKVPLTVGQTALVNGASGAIGSAAVQLLKYFGIRVTAVCGTNAVNKVLALGADEVINFETDDFTTQNRQYNYVFDAVGKSRFRLCKPILLPQGIYICTELGPNNENIWLPLTTMWSKGKRSVFPFPIDRKRSMLLMQKLLAEGRFSPLIDRTYTIDDAVEAFTYVESGRKLGNVVIEL